MDAMAYRSPENSSITCCVRNSRRRATTRKSWHLVYYSINGVPYIFLDSEWFWHWICQESARTTSPQNPGSALRYNSRLGREEIYRYQPWMELYWTSLQENLPHIHQWMHRQVAHEIWTPRTTQNIALAAQNVWGQRTTNPWGIHESSTRQRGYQTHPKHRWVTFWLCKNCG